MNDPNAPSFLRIHRGPASNAPESESTSVPLESGNAVRAFWGKFESATGWTMAPRSRRIGGTPSLMPAMDNRSQGPIVLDDYASGNLDGDLSDGLSDAALEESFVDSLTQVSAVGKSAATDLASAATDIIGELTEARQAIRRQHAELATRANVVIGEDSQAGLADRIAETLADASEACGCQAAAIYTLNDDTSELQIRSIFGLPDSRLTAGPRTLQGARGDLEAMVKNVVTIDDLNAGPLDTWNAPESAAAAICAVISVADIPMGTLWFFAEDTKHFGPAEVALARLAARSVATELSHAAGDPFATPTNLDIVAPVNSQSAKSQPVKSRSGSSADRATSDIRDVAQWQFQALPIGTAIAEDWKVDGMIESPHDFAIGWHTWDVLPDGSIQMAIAEAVQADITGAMSATVARAAMAAHSGYRHTPSQMLSRISDTLWQTSLGEQLMSMMYVRVDPETGEGEIASAGLITAMIASRMGYRPVVTGKSDPLCSHIDSQSVQETFRLIKGETLLAYSPGFLTGGINHTAMGGMLHDAIKSEAKNPLAGLRRSLAKMPLTCERGATALVRG